MIFEVVLDQGVEEGLRVERHVGMGSDVLRDLTLEIVNHCHGHWHAAHRLVFVREEIGFPVEGQKADRLDQGSGDGRPHWRADGGGP